MSKEKIYGIDLGTTNSCISVMEGGEPIIIASSEGQRTIPSIVAYKKDGERMVGIQAKRQSITNPDNSIISSKRLIGHTYKEIESELSKVAYSVKKSKKGLAAIYIPAIDKEVTPEEVGAAILQKLKTDADAYLGATINKAVITVPAYFNDSQRQATKNAGEIAGLEVVRIINEPTAAALAYGLNKEKSGNILVFDLGGGTFDVSILDIGEGTFEVISTSGDSHLGGDDFDNVIVDYILEEAKKSTQINLSKDSAAFQRIKEAAEKAKIELSSQLSTNINLPFITAEDNVPVHLSIDITRAKFESLSEGLLKRIKKPVMDALKAGVDKSKINDIILVGGASRIPCVQALVKELLGKEPSKSVNPDEAVALGAAVQGAIIAGDVTDIVLMDVTPLSLGVEVNGGMVDVLIPKNTTIPVEKKSIYTTAQSNQQEVTIHILQGERTLAKDNKSIGMFNLDGILPAPAHVPQIEVSFDLDVNGILSVKAKDIGTGKEQKITITQSSNLDQSEIDRMIKEAEEYAEADKEAKEYILMKNEIEMLCDGAESSIEMAKDKVDQELIDNLENAIKSAREALVKNVKEDIEREKENVLNASHALSEVLYKSHQGDAMTPEEGDSAARA
jgi:molecular chaperone DnaK